MSDSFRVSESKFVGDTMFNIKSMYAKLLIQKPSQTQYNIMLASEMDRMQEQINSLQGRLAAYEMERERGERGIHPALVKLREESHFNHKM